MAWLSLPKSPADGPPAGALTPAELRDAYRINGVDSRATVAIVDAFGFPKLPHVLSVYRAYFGLGSCTVSSGCLTIVNQRGGSGLPRFSIGWAVEEALDVETVSSACPTCKILLVEADSPHVSDLGTAVSYAADQPGVLGIGNPYDTVGVGDMADQHYGHFFDHPGIAVVASSGDNGFIGPAYPADSRFVVAAGGTSLHKADNSRGWTEGAWAQAGSGCSTLNPAISPQRDIHTGCGRFRATSDVSAAAAPRAGGLAWYGPVAPNQFIWGTSGGTSQSAVFIAAVYAMAGDIHGQANLIPYERRRQLFDVTTGFSGRGCKPTLMCKAKRGWDGPTGLGTPNGLGGF